ncbi:C45 family peptidase [Parendozoicomonas sp. Alg238-R29]|uniref:C45 family autoproteolytic acyltransferase/hydolase n=1 Tax=Parendozoicomonas sp. Alg238-R29 TaxID=2993446 RepID=UPI00248E37D0|nr:C45 family peptidase [Parendozoicomonas sp. Alg238-R29]
MTDCFPMITLSGSAENRGAIHGARLAENIASTIAFYAGLLRMTEADVHTTGRYFREQIHKFHPGYCEEIDALADAAHQPADWIYVLNARSELISQQMECSTITFRDNGLLGQNWDFSRPLLDLAVLLHITLDNNLQILTFTEPGIIGKIGLNNCGLGLCLNMLRLRRRCEGVPLHILMRALLETSSLEQARDLASSTPGARIGCLTMACNTGQEFCVEFAGNNCWFLSPPGQISLHTNHYLGRRLTPEGGIHASSHERLKTLAGLTTILRQQNIATMQRLLSDRSNSTWPVHQTWHTSLVPGYGEFGTIATIVMELPQRIMHIRKGNDPQGSFVSYPVLLPDQPESMD